MKNILIFKTDRLGDLLNISAVIYNLKLNFQNVKLHSFVQIIISQLQVIMKVI